MTPSKTVTASDGVMDKKDTEDFSRKYPGSTARKVDVNAVTDHDECVWLIDRIDAIRAAIQKQIEDAKSDALEGEFHDRDWFVSVNHALRRLNQKRNALQTRRGVLRREQKMKGQSSLERAFMDAAMKVLPVEEVRMIWDKVYSDRPELRQ